MLHNNNGNFIKFRLSGSSWLVGWLVKKSRTITGQDSGYPMSQQDVPLTICPCAFPRSGKSLSTRL